MTPCGFVRLVLLALVVALVAEAKYTGPRRTMVWFYTHDRGDDVIGGNIKWYTDRVNSITTAAPTTHNVGFDGGLDFLPFAPNCTYTMEQVFQDLTNGGVRVVPTVYNDQSGESDPSKALMPRLHALFANPQPFIDKAVELAIKYDLDGWNLDFEPSPVERITEEDGQSLVNVINMLAAKLHPMNKTVSLDVTDWGSSLWNHTLLNGSSLNKASDMGTYTSSFDAFESSARRMAQEYSLDKIGLGLCSVCSAQPFSSAELQERFMFMEKFGNSEIDMWGTPPDDWLPYLHAYLYNNGTEDYSFGVVSE